MHETKSQPIKKSKFPIAAFLHFLEYLFCWRFTYFENYLGISQHEEKQIKVQKRHMVHEDKTRVNPHYLRKKLECIDRKKSVYLSSPSGIRGIVDEILFLNDGTAAPLDHKYAEYKARTLKNHKYQLTIYGRLIRENFNVPVNRGFIIYTRSRNKLIEVPITFTEGMYMGLDKIIIGNLLNVVQKGVYPKPTKYKARMQRLLLQKYLRKSDLKSGMKGDQRGSRRLSQGPYELLQKTITAFVEPNIRYIVTGSVASMAYSESLCRGDLGR